MVTLGHGLRKRHEIRVRQPLAELTVITRDQAVTDAVASHVALIAEELNVATVSIDAEEDHLLHLSAQANFKVLGPRLAAATKQVAAAIAEFPHEVVSAIVEGAVHDVAGTQITVDDIVVKREPRQGLVVAAQGAVSVALDVTISPELAIEGLAREIVSVIQGERRALNLDVSDRIALTWQSNDGDVRAALRQHQELIAGEILATTVAEAETTQRTRLTISGRDLSVTVVRLGNHSGG